MTEMPVLGERIKLMRQRRNMTQGDLASGLCTASMISQIETGKARPSYHILLQIAQRLEVPVEFLIESSEANLEYVCTYRAAQMLIAGRDYTEGMLLLKQLLNTPRGQQDGVQLMCELIPCYLQVGQVANAIRLVEQLAREAESSEEHGLMALVCQHRGTIQFMALRYDNAIYQWERGLEFLRRVEGVDRYFYAGLLFRIAQAHAKLGQMQKSLAYCARTAPYFEHARTLTDQARMCLSLSKSFRQSSDHRQSITFGQRAGHLHNVLQHRARHERNRVQQALLIESTGRGQETRQTLATAVQQLQGMGFLEAAGLAALELAKLHLQASDVEAAEHACVQAQRWIPTPHTVRAKLQTLLGRVEVKRHRHSEGKRRIQQVVDTHYAQQRVFEWEEALSELAWVYADEEDFRHACQLLLSARTYSRNLISERGMCL
ncbi:helix-turn-helix domain-containing protein [Tumebacillus permanentifrigoris]|uniref:Helix-turn-helix protein n=1 Tax=Tumebacillus permanentifrigoris TaxID=378543 RepID=A0A316DBW0_9BACL|nr:helix-turn-helix transcriptional regulator [Tumebacillus permanentifrigoris]PWK14396.1 helix-turn-helix protein [Tumebacillus permanentifrigoris]